MEYLALVFFQKEGSKCKIDHIESLGLGATQFSRKLIAPI